MAKKAEPAKTTKVVPAEPKNQALVERAIIEADAFGDAAGAGMENVGANDILIPRLTLLQALSPQLSEKKVEYIEGAKVGDICDVGTGDIFKEIVFLPVFYRKDYLEWAPRASGKGLVNVHTDPKILDQTKRDDKNRPLLPNGNLIAETAQIFGLNMSAQGRKSFIPLTSTQLKKARRWMTLASGERVARKDGSTFTPPLFYRTYLLTSADESNNEGDWAGWRIERGQTIVDYTPHWPELLQLCKDFLTQLQAGSVRGDIVADEDAPQTMGQNEGRM